MRAASAFVWSCLWFATGCVSHVFRHDAPAEVLRIGLDASEDDLVMLDVVHGLYPRHRERLLLRVAHGWETAEVDQRADGLATLRTPLDLVLQARREAEAPARQQRFSARDTTRWSVATRARHRLLVPQDLPAAGQRSYAIENLRCADGSVDLELRGRRGAESWRVLGRVSLPPEFTPRALSTTEVVLLTPPLLVIDAVWVPISVASLVLLIPFGSLDLLFGSESDALPYWARAVGSRDSG